MGADDRVQPVGWRELALLRRFGGNLRDFLALLFRIPRKMDIRPVWPTPPRLVIGLALAIMALVAAILLIDVPASTAVRRLPLWLIGAFDTITEFGKSGWFLFPIGLFLLGLAAIVPSTLPRLSRLVIVSLAIRLSFIFGAIAVPGLFVVILKYLIGRARPFVEPDGSPFTWVPFGWNAEYASIPSGHATTAFAAAIAIGAVWPRARAFMWLYAFLVAASRVVVTAHYPSDLLASAFFGILGALLVRHTFAIRRLGFVIDRIGAVHPLPGPSLWRLKSVAQRLLAQ
jgi:membrane-associated phospholipid phosphatase